MRLVENRPDLMVVPSIGIIVHYDDGCAAPFGPGSQEVDQVDYEGLFIQRVGIPRMSVLVRRGLEEVHGRKIARADRGVKVVEVILMVFAAGVPNLGNICGPRVSRVGGRRMSLEKGVMRGVIPGCPRNPRRRPPATRGAVT